MHELHSAGKLFFNLVKILIYPFELELLSPNQADDWNDRRDQNHIPNKTCLETGHPGVLRGFWVFVYVDPIDIEIENCVFVI